MGTVLYEFTDAKTGEGVEEFMDSDCAPRIGSLVTINGRRLRRVASLPQALVEPDYRHVAWQLRANEPGAPRYGAKGTPEEGQPIFNSKKEIREFQAKNADYYGTKKNDYGFSTAGRSLKPTVAASPRGRGRRNARRAAQ